MWDLVEDDKSNVSSLDTMSMDLDAHDDEAQLKQLADANVYFEFLRELLAKLNFSRTPLLVRHVIDTLFEAIIRQIDDFDDAKSHGLPNLLVEFHLCELVHKCECKYPSEFDACLSKLLLTVSSSSSVCLNQKQRNYFLTTISCKFGSFKCSSTFKYQHVGAGTGGAELSLFLALNHANEGRH